MAAHQALLSLGFSRQEYWSGLPFPSPMHESEKWKWSRSVVSDPSRPHRLQPTRLFHAWDFPGKTTGVGCHCLLQVYSLWGCKRVGHDLATKQNVVDINVIMWGLSLLLFICTWELEVDKDNRIVWDYSLNYSFPMIWTERTTKGKNSLKQLLGELREQMSGKLLSKNSV